MSWSFNVVDYSPNKVIVTRPHDLTRNSKNNTIEDVKRTKSQNRECRSQYTDSYDNNFRISVQKVKTNCYLSSESYSPQKMPTVSTSLHPSLTKASSYNPVPQK